MHIVSIQVTVKKELLDEFEQAILHNARESVARDNGCLMFDVSQAVDDPTVWLYHEVYDGPEAPGGVAELAAVLSEAAGLAA